MSKSENIKDCNKKETATVFVAVCTDCNYLAPALVTVRSIALHVSESYNYVIYLLSEDPLGFFQKRAVLSAISGRDNVRVVFIEAGDLLGDVNLSASGPIRGVTRATYVRLLLPELLPDVEKVLYLDVDAIAMLDVAKIFFYPLDGFLIGGVRDISGHECAEQRCEELGIGSLDEYVNAGALLMNLSLMRKADASKAMLDMARERVLPYNDQDIINSFCFGRILKLPTGFNVIVDFKDKPDEVSRVLGIDYASEAKDPLVLHFAGRTKPWYYPKNECSLLWWETARSLKGLSALAFTFYKKRLLKNKKK